LWLFFLSLSNIITEKFDILIILLWSFFHVLAKNFYFFWSLVLSTNDILTERLYVSWSYLSSFVIMTIEKFDFIYHDMMEKLCSIDEFHFALILIAPLYITVVIILILRKNDRSNHRNEHVDAGEKKSKISENIEEVENDREESEERGKVKDDDDDDLSDKEERVAVLKASRSCHGNLVIRELNFVIDEIDKKTVIGKEDKNGKITDLTKKDIDFCDKKGLSWLTRRRAGTASVPCARACSPVASLGSSHRGEDASQASGEAL
jgi:hypothetical protein